MKFKTNIKKFVVAVFVDNVVKQQNSSNIIYITQNNIIFLYILRTLEWFRDYT